MRNKEITRKAEKIRKAVLGDKLSRFLSFLGEKTLKLIARQQFIPYSLKKDLARRTYERIKEHSDSLPKGVRALEALMATTSIPVHLYQNEWNGTEYQIWEEMSKYNGTSEFIVIVPSIQFPNFCNSSAKSRNDSREAIRLETIFDSYIWDNTLFAEPIFRDMKSYKRPRLQAERRLKDVPHRKIPESKRIPYFTTDSLADANAQARGVIQAYQRYEKQIGDIIRLLETDSSVRDEFTGTIEKHGEAQLLQKYGLDIDILPKVIKVTEEVYENISYTIYEVSGGSSGENKHQLWAFIHGIQFPNFEKDERLEEKDRRTAREVLERVIFKNVLYNEPYFLPFKNGCLNKITPDLRGTESYEAKVANFNSVPNERVMPFILGFDYESTRQKIKATIMTYNSYKGQLHEIIERLATEEKIMKEINRQLNGISVHQNIDCVANILGSYGARFIVENPVYLGRRRELDEFVSGLKT